LRLGLRRLVPQANLFGGICWQLTQWPPLGTAMLRDQAARPPLAELFFAYRPCDRIAALHGR